jgi:hypothetical protein
LAVPDSTDRLCDDTRSSDFVECRPKAGADEASAPSSASYWSKLDRAARALGETRRSSSSGLEQVAEPMASASGYWSKLAKARTRADTTRSSVSDGGRAEPVAEPVASLSGCWGDGTRDAAARALEQGPTRTAFFRERLGSFDCLDGGDDDPYCSRASGSLRRRRPRWALPTVVAVAVLAIIVPIVSVAISFVPESGAPGPGGATRLVGAGGATGSHGARGVVTSPGGQHGGQSQAGVLARSYASISAPLARSEAGVAARVATLGPTPTPAQLAKAYAPLVDARVAFDQSLLNRSWPSPVQAAVRTLVSTDVRVSLYQQDLARRHGDAEWTAHYDDALAAQKAAEARLLQALGLNGLPAT